MFQKLPPTCDFLPWFDWIVAHPHVKGMFRPHQKLSEMKPMLKGHDEYGYKLWLVGWMDGLKIGWMAPGASGKITTTTTMPTIMMINHVERVSRICARWWAGQPAIQPTTQLFTHSHTLSGSQLGVVIIREVIRPIERRRQQQQQQLLRPHIPFFKATNWVSLWKLSWFEMGFLGLSPSLWSSFPHTTGEEEASLSLVMGACTRFLLIEGSPHETLTWTRDCQAHYESYSCVCFFPDWNFECIGRFFSFVLGRYGYSVLEIWRNQKSFWSHQEDNKQIVKVIRQGGLRIN